MTWNPSLLALAGAILVAGFTMQPAPVIQTGRYVLVSASFTHMVLDTASGASYRWNVQNKYWEAMTYTVRDNMPQQLP